MVLYNMLPAFLSIHTTSSKKKEKKDGTSFALQISTPSINIFFPERVRERERKGERNIQKKFLLFVPNAEIKSSVFVNDDSTNDWSGRDFEIIFFLFCFPAASYLHCDAPQSLRLSSFLLYMLVRFLYERDWFYN